MFLGRFREWIDGAGELSYSGGACGRGVATCIIGDFIFTLYLDSCDEVTLGLFLSSMVQLFLWWLCNLNRQCSSTLRFPHG